MPGDWPGPAGISLLAPEYSRRLLDHRRDSLPVLGVCIRIPCICLFRRGHGMVLCCHGIRGSPDGRAPFKGKKQIKKHRGNVHNQPFHRWKRAFTGHGKAQGFPTSCKRPFPQLHGTAGYTHSHNACCYKNARDATVYISYRSYYRSI